MEEELANSANSKNIAILNGKKREFDLLREELKRSKRAVKVMTGIEAENSFKNDVTSALEQRRQRYVTGVVVVVSRRRLIIDRLALNLP